MGVEVDVGRAQGLLALSYQVATAVLTKLGEQDLAWIAAERGLTAAQQSENPVVLGSLFRSVTHALHATGRFAEGVQLTEAAAGVLAPQVARASPAFLSVYGSLFLTGAMTAARADDRGSAQTFLREAEDAGNRLGRDANLVWTAFGPTNVTLHRVGTAMELGDVQIALDLGPQVDATTLPGGAAGPARHRPGAGLQRAESSRRRPIGAARRRTPRPGADQAPRDQPQPGHDLAAHPPRLAEPRSRRPRPPAPARVTHQVARSEV